MLIHLFNQMKTIGPARLHQCAKSPEAVAQPLIDTLVGGTVSDIVKGNPELIAEMGFIHIIGEYKVRLKIGHACFNAKCR